MNRARTRALVIAICLIVFSALVVSRRAGPQPLPERPPSERPVLLLITSLPLMFGEQFSLQDSGSPALGALQKRYRVAPIGVSDARQLAKGRLLLMAHPLAQPAEDLVALDQWVRRGGRLLLLADPLLEWPSSRPLGDPLRPPPMFMDTGLLAHWGLSFAPPGERGPAMRDLDGWPVLTVSPGKLSGRCPVSSDGLVADCRIGKGYATIIADADFLDVDRLGSQSKHNLDALMTELAKLEAK